MIQMAKNRGLKIAILLAFVVFSIWWLYINLVVKSPDHTNVNNQLFGALYGVIALVGGVAGLLAAHKWGGRKSLLGRALVAFSLGLLAQEFGQIAYSFYTYVLKVAIPYPSIGDVGYFGSVLLYIYAGLQLARAAGIKFSLREHKKKVIAVALPAVLLISSYAIFLRGYQFDFSSLSACLRVFLDFGYPLGQAIYIAIALITYLLSQRLLGGIMKNRILLLLFALLVQYIADFSFLYAAKSNSAYPGGPNDFAYLAAYTVMGLGLNSFRFSISAAPNEKLTADVSGN